MPSPRSKQTIGSSGICQCPPESTVTRVPPLGVVSFSYVGVVMRGFLQKLALIRSIFAEERRSIAAKPKDDVKNRTLSGGVSGSVSTCQAANALAAGNLAEAAPVASPFAVKHCDSDIARMRPSSHNFRR